MTHIKGSEISYLNNSFNYQPDNAVPELIKADTLDTIEWWEQPVYEDPIEGIPYVKGDT